MEEQIRMPSPKPRLRTRPRLTSNRSGSGIGARHGLLHRERKRPRIDWPQDAFADQKKLQAAAFATAADSERKAPPGVEHSSGVIVAGVTWIGNDLHTNRELVILGDLKTMEELEDGLFPRGSATWNREGKSCSREVILPAAKGSESQPGLCRLPHFGEGPVGVGIPCEDLKFVANVLIKDDCHSIVFRQTQVCPCVHVPQPDRIPAFAKPFDGGVKPTSPKAKMFHRLKRESISALMVWL